MSPKKPEAIPCPDCGGTGKRSVATEDVRCAACEGTGKVNA